MGFLSGLGFGSPIWAVVGLPFVVGLVALYTVRSKPKVKVLPSLSLWRQVLRKKRPNSFLSRYRNSLFFLLQLLAFLAIAAALARPFLRSDTSGDVLIVVDVSASMGALDGRMDEARGVALEVIDALTEGARGQVIAAGAVARPAGPLTGDRGALRAEVQALTVEEAPGLPGPELLETLAALRTPATGAVHLFTDGYSPEELAPGLPGARLVFHYVGRTRDNVAVTRLDVTPRGEVFQVAALVRNYSPQDAEVEVTLHAAGAPRSQRETVSGGGRERLFLFQDARPDDGVLGVRSRVARGPTDRLPTDDDALSAPRRGAVRILLVSPRGEALERALELNRAVAVDRFAPAQLEEALGRLEEYDLVVAEDVVHEALATRPLLLFHGASLSPWSTGRTLEAPEVTALDATHPVMRYLNLGEVRIRRAHPLDKLEGGRALLSSGFGPLMVAQDAAEGRRILCAFHLGETDLAQRIAFPILLTNAIRWLLANDSKLRGHFRVGQPLRLRGGKPVEVVTPDGDTRTHPAEEGAVRILSPFERTGVYRIRRGADVPLPYPVNLLSAPESDLEPPGEGTEELGHGEAAGQAGGGSHGLWSSLLLAALAILGLEWLLLAARGGAS